MITTAERRYLLWLAGRIAALRARYYTAVTSEETKAMEIYSSTVDAAERYIIIEECKRLERVAVAAIKKAAAKR